MNLHKPLQRVHEPSQSVREVEESFFASYRITPLQ